VGADVSSAPEIIDLSSISESEIEQEVMKRVDAEARRPFDLIRGPVFRAILLRFAPTHHVLMLSMHHIVCDRWSADVLARELAACFAAFVAGKTSPLPELSFQFGDYAAWEHDRIVGGALDHQLAYWRKQLADAPAVLTLPTCVPEPDAITHGGARV